jgi:hypothetical protein
VQVTDHTRNYNDRSGRSSTMDQVVIHLTTGELPPFSGRERDLILLFLGGDDFNKDGMFDLDELYKDRVPRSGTETEG